jgi:hypothetical protein
MHQLDNYFILDRGSGREASPSWVRGQFLAESSCEQIKRKEWDNNKELSDKTCLRAEHN